MEKAKILVQGIVQGVGFRPTVYRIAKGMNINGYVRNLGNIVEIIIEGQKHDINEFITNLNENKPPISKISSLTIEWLDHHVDAEFNDFKILESSENFSGSSVIPPDIATCNNCLDEVFKDQDRRNKYPFTACTDCGPRFTVISSVPYDRIRTSMNNFPLCEECEAEYKDPEDRRYHAEATCCPVCGPEVFLYREKNIESKNPIKKAARLIDAGNILAIKGIGGTHLVVKTTEDYPVNELRKRLGRYNQPFACMSKDVNTIKTFAEVSILEKNVLESRRRPIVVLNKNDNYMLSPIVSPELHNLGVMLPYSALHHLLFSYTNEPAYIMTSANIPGEPMLIENREITSKLNGIADCYLLHNREIVNRCDDSVVRFRGNEMAFIRRSRGYVPEPYDFSDITDDLNVLALGPEIDVTFSLLKDGKCYVSQHIGDTTKYETFRYLQKAVDHMMAITKTGNIDVVACDLHPMFFTTKLAEEMSKEFESEILRVQHHHAHAAALCVDNDIDEVICIAADGVGYGDDGTAWGGEILLSQGSNCERLASLMPQTMAGGDLTTKYPVRMVMSLLYNHMDTDELVKLMKTRYIDYFKHGEREVDLVLKQLQKGFNTSITTSTGRILDATSAALRICGKRTYEGECAMKLESKAYYSKNTSLEIPYEIGSNNGMEFLNTSKILSSALEMKEKGVRIEDIARASQKAVALGLAEMALNAAENTGVKVIGGSGGVFYNEAISVAVRDAVESAGYKFVQHKNSCAGDGSVSMGQAAVASWKSKGL
ncbi:MAG: carbamoyltransferase HypF [Methanobacterium sp.]